MKCPKCNRETEPRWKVCPSCGLPLAGNKGSKATRRAAKQAHRAPAQTDCPICDGTGMARCWWCMDGRPRYPGIDTVCRYCSGTSRWKCSHCGGRGALIGDYRVVVCRACGGKRQRTCTNCSGKGLAWIAGASNPGTCVYCHGSGMEPCLTCMSSGREPFGALSMTPGVCYNCNGKGKTECLLCRGAGSLADPVRIGSMSCPDCRGAGQVLCMICHGSGKWSE